MREVLGPVAAHGLLLAAGYGVLAALGWREWRPLAVLGRIGLAYLAGVTVVLLFGIAILVLGLPFDLPVFAAVAALVAVGGVGAGALARRRARDPSGRADKGSDLPTAATGARVRAPTPLDRLATASLGAFSV